MPQIARYSIRKIGRLELDSGLEQELGHEYGQ